LGADSARLSLGLLLEDFVVVVLSLIVGAAGIVLAVVPGNAAINGLGELLYGNGRGTQPRSR
jgi:hypothetical protein